MAQHALGVGRLEEDVRRGLAGQTAAQLAGADERLHARRGFVVEKLRPIERATTPVVTQIAADQERARRVRQPSQRRREPDEVHRHEPEDDQSGRDVERRIGDDRVRPVEHAADAVVRHQDVVGVKVAVADGARLGAGRTASGQPREPRRQPAEPAARGAFGQVREVSVERQAPGLEPFPGHRAEERHRIEIVQTRLDLGEDARHAAEAGLRQRLAGQSLHDQEGSAESCRVRGREKNARRRVAEIGECVLGRPLAQRARGVVVRVEQPENQRTGEVRRRHAQAEGEDLRIEAARDGHGWLGEIEARQAERTAQMVAQSGFELCHAPPRSTGRRRPSRRRWRLRGSAA